MDVGAKKEITMDRIKFIILLFVAWLVCACSVTKNLPEGEVLYIGQKPLQIQGDDSLNVVGAVALEEVRAALATAPNNAFFWAISPATGLPRSAKSPLSRCWRP